MSIIVIVVVFAVVVLLNLSWNVFGNSLYSLSVLIARHFSSSTLLVFIKNLQLDLCVTMYNKIPRVSYHRKYTLFCHQRFLINMIFFISLDVYFFGSFTTTVKSCLYLNLTVCDYNRLCKDNSVDRLPKIFPNIINKNRWSLSINLKQ